MGPDVDDKLRSIVAGDRAAAAWLYDTFSSELYRRLRLRYAYLGDAELEDLLHDVYVQLFNHRCRLLQRFLDRPEAQDRSQGALARYMWDLVCGLATNRRRSAAVRKVVAIDQENVKEIEAEAERTTIHRDTITRLDKCLKQRGERVYLYCKLRYQGGYSPEEIAALTGWSRRTTYKLRQALNQALRRCSQELGLSLIASFLHVVCLGGLLVQLTACSRQAPPEGISVTLRGHDELVLDGRGNLTPLFLGAASAQRPRDLCLEVPVTLDTSQWEVSLRLEGGEAVAHRSPSARTGSTLCYPIEIPSESFEPRDLSLCCEVKDLYDSFTFSLPCQRLRYGDDRGERERLVTTFQALSDSLSSAGTDLVAWSEELRKLAELHAERGFPVLAVDYLLIASDRLRKGARRERLEAARRLLASLPAWLERPEASEWGAKAAYARAMVHLASDWELEAAWRQLERAEALSRRIAHPMQIYVALKQADILARVGALAEARRRFEALAGECRELQCPPSVLANADSQIAWLILQDPQAGEGELAQAEARITAALEGAHGEVDRAERSNLQVNQAYLRLRQGRDPGEALQAARRTLSELPPGNEVRGQLLLAWADLVEGLFAASQGNTERAYPLCQRASTEARFPRLAAWAQGCLGRIHRQGKDLSRAQWAFEKALSLHQYAGPEGLGQDVGLGPGERADHYYRAARVALERGHGEAAWQYLARLDELSVEPTSPRCPGTGEGVESSGAARTTRIEAEMEDLLRQLAAVEAPSSRRRKRHLEPVRRRLLERLQELSRQRSGCGPVADGRPGEEPALGWGFRAVALEDEVLLLRRHPSGTVTLERRSPLPRREVWALSEAVERTLEERELDDEAWTGLVSPLARALVPSTPEALGPVTPFALHGALQGVPLAALPIASQDGGPHRWLGELTTVVLVTPGGAVNPVAAEVGGVPTFAVDPTGDLPAAQTLSSHYRRIFPQSRILSGADLTEEALRQALPHASIFHMDTHGHYQPAFPELSSLQLADGPMTLRELAELASPRSLVNLSGCQTGRWPRTADSGRYGIAGLFARRGTPWVVASRADLTDRLALRFNLAFYGALARGGGVPEAYAHASRQARREFSAVEWSALFLLTSQGTLAVEGNHRD